MGDVSDRLALRWGFDTASEVEFLGLLFAAGMSSSDTTDGVAMQGAYGWVYVKPMREMCCNIAITSNAVVVALESGASGVFWEAVRNVPLGDLGFSVVGIFLARRPRGDARLPAFVIVPISGPSMRVV